MLLKLSSPSRVGWPLAGLLICLITIKLDNDNFCECSKLNDTNIIPTSQNQGLGVQNAEPEVALAGSRQLTTTTTNPLDLLQKVAKITTTTSQEPMVLVFPSSTTTSNPPTRSARARLHLKFSSQTQFQRHMIRNEPRLQIARSMTLAGQVATPGRDTTSEESQANGVPMSNNNDQSATNNYNNRTATGRRLIMLIENNINNNNDNRNETNTGNMATNNQTNSKLLSLIENQRRGRDELLTSVDVAVVYSDSDIHDWLYEDNNQSDQSNNNNRVSINNNNNNNRNERQSETAFSRGGDSGSFHRNMEQIGSTSSGQGQLTRQLPIARFKLAPSSQTATGITVPPLWRTLDVVAENYTTRKVVDEANIFAIRLLHQTNREKLGNQNLLQPPFAIYKGLSLLLAGAHGDTAKELDRVLLGTQAHFDANKLTHDPDRRRLVASLGDVLNQLHSSAVNHQRYPTPSSGSLTQSSPSKDTQFAPSASSSDHDFDGGDVIPFNGADDNDNQYLIVANNLLFSPRAYEIAPDFRQYLQSYHNETSLTRVETGSMESIQLVNGWIKRATQGMIPYVMKKKDTFDEFNVMSMLATTWLKQTWQDTFYRISSSLRSNIRLKGQGRSLDPQQQTDTKTQQIQPPPATPSSNYYSILRPGNLMEFVDDKRESHFVEYIISRPTGNIQHYKTQMNGFTFELISVPFGNSNHRWIALMPVSAPAANISTSQQITDSIQKILMEPHIAEDPIDPVIIPISNNTNRLSSVHNQPKMSHFHHHTYNTNNLILSQQDHHQSIHLDQQPASSLHNTKNYQTQFSSSSSTGHNNNPNSQNSQATVANETDSSLLTKFLTSFAETPNKSMRLIWNLVAPELITRQIMKNIQLARQNGERQSTGGSGSGNGVTTSPTSQDSENSDQLLISGQYPLIQLSIPVIREEADSSLVGELNHIGIVNSFDPSQANFIGINGHPFNYNELYLSNVLAKITFNLDEHGVNHDRTIKSLEQLRAHPNRRQHDSSRLRLTKTKLIESSRKINEVKLNKPFIWFTVDIKTRLIFITGVVRNPNQMTAA